MSKAKLYPELYPYIEAAVGHFPTASCLEAAANNEGIRAWIVSHWIESVGKIPRATSLPTGRPHVLRLLRGDEACQPQHIHYLHELLELDAAGFDCEELWLVPATEGVLCEPGEFGQRLSAKQETDLMRSLSSFAVPAENAEPWLKPHVPLRLEGPRPEGNVWVKGTTPERRNTVSRSRLKFAAGQRYRLDLLPPRSGRLLMVAERKPTSLERTRSYHLFNHALGFGQSPEVEAGRPVLGLGWEAELEPSEWTLLVAIWPRDLSPQPLGLGGLLDRARGELPRPRTAAELLEQKTRREELLKEMSEPEMRRLAQVVRDQRTRPAEPQIDVMLYDVSIAMAA